ncbi:MAG: Gfo/Idh/MocA family protein [Actinomycetota bacterium]
MRIGLVGYGNWGPMFVRNFEDIEGAEVAWVCDRDEQRRDASKQRHPSIQTIDDLDEAIGRGEADAVVIATPPTTHEALARKALEHDLHVLVEKPLAMSSKGAKGLAELSHTRGRTLMVGHILRYSAALQTMKQVIQDGDLGEIYYVASTRVNLGRHHRDVNVMWDLGPHDVSAMVHLLGAVPEAVSAWGQSFIQPGLEDVAFVYMRFPGGQLAHSHLSWLDPLKLRQFVVVGSRKMLVYDDVNVRLTLHDKGVDQVPAFGSFEEFHLAYRYGESHDLPVEQAEPLAAECRHFLECIKYGKDPVSGSKEGFEVVRILEAAQESMESRGAEVPIQWS